MAYMADRRVPKKKMLIPGTKPWREVITASKVPTILGINRYQTVGDLWSQCRGEAVPKKHDEEALERMALGHDLENGIQNAWLRKNPGYKLGKLQSGSREVAFTDKDLPFPNQVTIDSLAWRGKKAHIIECKTSRDMSKWNVNGAAPDDVVAQVMFQMGVSGIHQATIGALLWQAQGVVFWDVEFKKDVYEGMVEQCRLFYDSLTGDEPPTVNPFLLEALKPIPIPVEGVTVGDDDPELIQLLDMREEIKHLQEREKALRQVLSQRYEGSQKVTVGGRAVMSWQKGRFSTSRVPDEYKYLLSDVRYQKQSFDPTVLAERNPEVYEIAVGTGSFRFV